VSIHEVLDQVIELTHVEGCSATAYQADIFAGERLHASVTADGPVDVVVCREEDYASWQGAGAAAERVPPNALVMLMKRTQAQVDLPIRAAGCYCVVAINRSSTAASVSFEIGFLRSPKPK
jgi:hypothetical protein